MATASGVMLGGQVLMLVGAIADSLANPPYAFRPLPEFFLVPATFPSEAQREAFFDTLGAKLTDATARQRAWVNEHCIRWPCKLSDESACPNPYCEGLRVQADKELGIALGRVSALRAQVRIVPP